MLLSQVGSLCEASQDTVCEHQSCYTTRGQECTFPFAYKGVTYTQCTSVDVYQPWCATQLNTATGGIQGWGLCLPDCDYIVPDVSCLDPPPVPRFGLQSDSGEVIFENYISDWFTLQFTNNSDGTTNQTNYRITRDQRAKLYQPWMVFDENELKEYNIELFAQSNEDHFNGVYEIMKNGSSVVYECPKGWVFNSSNSITHMARCLNWTWVVDFDPAMPCVRK